MTKIALVKVHQGYVNSGSYCEDYFRNFDCLDFQEVSEAELMELKEAVTLYNSKQAKSGVCLWLIEQCGEDVSIRLLSDLKNYRQKVLLQQQQAQEEAERTSLAAKKKREANKLKRTAKSLGVSVEDLLALKGKSGS